MYLRIKECIYVKYIIEQCPKPRTIMCIDGVLTADDNISCMKGYTRIVYDTSVCLNQTIEDTICKKFKLS